MDINKTWIVLLMPKHQFSYWPKMEKVFIEASFKMESTEISFLRHYFQSIIIVLSHFNFHLNKFVFIYTLKHGK